MLLTFKNIRIHNFLSISDAELNFQDRGIVLIRGINKSQGSADSNGSGKSALISESVFYALTGETLRGTSDIVNIFSSDNSGTEIELEFNLDNISYRILRTRDHPVLGNNLKIWKNETDISGDKLKKSEAILKEELGIVDSEFLSGILILGQSGDTFSALKPKDRKERLELLSQSAGFINKLETMISDSLVKYAGKSNELQLQVSNLEYKLTTIKDSRVRDAQRLSDLYAKEEERSPTDQLEKELEVLMTEGISKKSDIGHYNSDIQQLNEERYQYDSQLKQEVSQYMSQITTLESENRSLKSKIQIEETSLDSLYHSKCPTCGQWINSPQFVQSMTEGTKRKIEEYNVQIEENSKSVNSLKIKLSERQSFFTVKIDALLQKIDELQLKVNELNKELDTIRNKVINLKVEIKLKKESHQREIEELTKRLVEFNSQETSLNVELSSLTSLKGRIDLKLNILTWLKKMCSKDFRGYLLSGVIDYLNTKLNFYSQALFGTSFLKLNLDGTKIFITYDGRQYESLSGGERKLADIAVQFSLRDMLKTTLGYNSNILILDEVFENIDTKGTDNIIKLVTSFSEIESIFVISHAHLEMPCDSVIQVVKGIDKTTQVYM